MSVDKTVQIRIPTNEDFFEVDAAVCSCFDDRFENIQAIGLAIKRVLEAIDGPVNSDHDYYVYNKIFHNPTQLKRALSAGRTSLTSLDIQKHMIQYVTGYFSNLIKSPDGSYLSAGEFCSINSLTEEKFKELELTTLGVEALKPLGWDEALVIENHNKKTSNTPAPQEIISGSISQQEIISVLALQELRRGLAPLLFQHTPLLYRDYYQWPPQRANVSYHTLDTPPASMHVSNSTPTFSPKTNLTSVDIPSALQVSSLNELD